MCLAFLGQEHIRVSQPSAPGSFLADDHGTVRFCTPNSHQKAPLKQGFFGNVRNCTILTEPCQLAAVLLSGFVENGPVPRGPRALQTASKCTPRREVFCCPAATG